MNLSCSHGLASSLIFAKQASKSGLRFVGGKRFSEHLRSFYVRDDSLKGANFR
jgi:hypothetical protein